MKEMQTMALALILLVLSAVPASASDARQEQAGAPPTKGPKIAIVLYEGADELDIIGPREVLSAAASQAKRGEIYTVSATGEPLRLLTGTRVIPDYSFANAPKADIIIVPGAKDTRGATGDKKVLGYIAETAKDARWVVGVCSGSEVLLAAGPAQGKRITSHHHWLERLRERNGEKNVLSNVRYVRDGKLLTSAGVSAGIDMALWLAGQLYGVEVARSVQAILEYYPAPPYAGEV